MALAKPALFQFHTGSIKRRNAREHGYARGKFQFHTGSIKSYTPSSPIEHTLDKFQFHTGSIKRKLGILVWNPLPMFQFHTGSIKSLSGSLQYRLCCPRFNSILVRLKEPIAAAFLCQVNACFNSILVRLKAH